MLSGGYFSESSMAAGIINSYRDRDLEQKVQLILKQKQYMENILDLATEIHKIFNEE